MSRPGRAILSAGRRKRFEHEARATAALNHPNLRTVDYVGAVADHGSTITELSRKFEID